LYTFEENEMTTSPSPNNRPEPDDQAGTSENGAEAETAPATQSQLEKEDEVAERLGDFA
jgi:hypothetical protein